MKSKEKRQFAIRVPLGYVHGIDKSWMMVQVTENVEDAKKWASMKTAFNFLMKWDDTGVGLSSKDAEIVEV